MSLHTGREMPRLGLGHLPAQASHRRNRGAALEAGYRMIDTSGDYHTQRGIGEALQRIAASTRSKPFTS